MKRSLRNLQRIVIILATISSMSDGFTIKCHFDKFTYSHTNFVDPQFEHPSETYYRCLLHNLTITSSTNSVDEKIYIDKTEYNNVENLKEMLWVEASKLDWIPPEFFQYFPKLDYFVLVESEIQNLERSSFRYAYVLKKMRIEKVYIPRINQLVFSDIPSLEYLSIANADVKAIDERAFEGLELLKGLYLDNNKLIMFEEAVFQTLVSLEEIFVSNNKLKVLIGDLFRNNPKLRIAYFRDNKIFVIHSDLFDYTPELTYVNFEDNTCLDDDFNIVNGYYSPLLRALDSCSEYRYLYYLLIPFILLIICLIAYSYYLAVVKRMKLFHK